MKNIICAILLSIISFGALNAGCHGKYCHHKGHGRGSHPYGYCHNCSGH